ncbi:MAG: hypothetical protein AAGB93_17830 [Planctomycetota bacterium]
MIASVRSEARAFGAVLRCEWGSHRWTNGLLLSACIAGLLGAFWLFDVPAVPTSGAAVRTYVLLAVAISVPAVADVFASSERSGQAAALRRLPAKGRSVVLGKVVLLAATMTSTALLMILTADGASRIEALAMGQILPLHTLLDPFSQGPAPWIVGCGTLVATAALAVIGRNALLATVAGVVLVGGLLALLAKLSVDRPPAGWRALALTAAFLIANPVSLGAMGCAALAVDARRGKLARSGWRRAAWILAAPVALATTAAAGAVVTTGVRGLPPFDEPEGTLMKLELSRDGALVALELLQPQGVGSQTSLWIADTTQLDFQRVNEVSPGRWSTGLLGSDIVLAGWRADSDRIQLLLQHRWEGWGDLRLLEFDPATRDRLWVDYEEVRTHSEFHGVFIQWATEGVVRRLVHVESGDPVDIGMALPRVPEIARDAVFYVDPARSLHRVDLRTGEDRVVEREFCDGDKFSIGPYGTHAISNGREGSRLVELGSGRSRRLKPVRSGQWTSTEGTYAERGLTHDPAWTLVTVEREERLAFERSVHRLCELRDGRWLGINHYDAALHLFEADGRLQRTIRVGRQAAPKGGRTEER